MLVDRSRSRSNSLLYGIKMPQVQNLTIDRESCSPLTCMFRPTHPLEA